MLANSPFARVRLTALALIGVPAVTIPLYLRYSAGEVSDPTARPWHSGSGSGSTYPDYLPVNGDKLEAENEIGVDIWDTNNPSTAERLKSWFGWSSVSSLSSSGSSSSNEGVSSGRVDIVTVPDLEDYGAAFLDDVVAAQDFERYPDYGLHMGDRSDLSLSAYTLSLLSIYHEYFDPTSSLLDSSSSNSPSHSFLTPLLSRLNLRLPSSPLPPCPKHIITTDKHTDVDDLPEEFKRWSEIMPDWEIRYFDDEALRGWVKERFGGTRAEEVWKRLPRQVLKTDVFRYMAMLADGGIYTDSDTAPIIRADDWGYPHEDRTPPLLNHLSRLLSLSSSRFSGSASESAEIEGTRGSSAYETATDERMTGPPGLVISVESDAIDFGWDNWREIGLSRAVQITQWTFMARPGHPVFLDALGQALRKTEAVERESRNGEVENALEWTGPGVFTDAVYRYLLARWGFSPDDLIHQKTPIRVGDVLILPAGSYSSISPFSDEPQRDWAAVFHGFSGRWRAEDPAIQAQEEEKKRKEVEEERERQLEQEMEREVLNFD